MLNSIQKAAAWDKSPSQLTEEEALYIQDPIHYELVHEGMNIDKIGKIQNQSAWVDVENKAKRLIADGQVFPEDKKLFNLDDPAGPLYITGTVVGDHSTYKCQIWTANSNPKSLAVRSWACQCTWNRYVWNRTRQWRKYEGRICSHILALYWQAKSLPLDEESQQAIEDSKGKKRQEETLIDVGPLKLPIPNIKERPERVAPDTQGYETEVQMNTQPTLPGMEDTEIRMINEDTGEVLDRDTEQPAEQAMRPLNLDDQQKIFDLDRKVKQIEQRQRLKNIKERSKKMKTKSSNLTAVRLAAGETATDLTEIIQLMLFRGADVQAVTLQDFWGERRGGLHPHPDAMPLDHMEDGNFVFNPEHLGWDPDDFTMGSDKEERGTYGLIPAQSQVQILSIDSKDKIALISYDIGNEQPNHNRIDVWVPVKSLYLI